MLIVAALCLQAAIAKKDGKKPSKSEHPKKGFIDPLKGKREAAIASYPSSGPYRSSHLLHLQPAGGSLSIGAGYSLGGSKFPSFSHSGSGSYGGSHYHGLNSLGSHGFGNSHSGYSYPKPSMAFSSHSPSVSKIRYTSIGAAYPIASIGSHSSGGSKFGGSLGGSLGGSFGGFLGGSSFSGGSHSGPSHFSSGSHPFGQAFSASKPQVSYGIPQYAAFAKPVESYGAPAATYGVPVISGSHGGSSSSSLPSYAIGTKGLGAYASSNSIPGISGHLFTPASSHELPAVMYGAPSGSFGSLSSGGHGGVFSPQFSFGGSGSSFGGSGSSFGGSGSSFGGSGNSFGGHGFSSSSKKFSDLLNGQNKGGSGNAFKPSVYLGSAEGSSNGHGISSFSHAPSSSYGSPSIGHSALLSGSPIYLAPKVISAASSSPSFESHSSGGQSSSPFHGSVSLTGSYEIPSSGHSASSLNFGSSNGGYSHNVPSVGFGTSSFGHDSDSSSFGSQSIGHGSITGAHLLQALGQGSISESYVMPSGGHVSISGLEGLTSDNAGQTSGYSNVVKHDTSASSYASSSPFTDSGYGGSAGYNFGDASLGKQELPSTGSISSFLSGGHGAGSLSSSLDEHKYSSPQEMYSQENFGNHKGSYSSQNNVYVSPVQENYPEQRENKYDTIKYSRDISEEEILKH